MLNFLELQTKAGAKMLLINTFN